MLLVGDFSILFVVVVNDEILKTNSFDGEFIGCLHGRSKKFS